MRHASSLMLLCLAGGGSWATSLDQISSRELYERSPVVADVLIERAEMINVGSVRCGARYEVTVLHDFKGGGSRMTFEGPNGLEIGGEYLLFFKQHEPRNHLNSSEEQITSCPPPSTGYTPDFSRGILKAIIASGPEGWAFEVYGAFIGLPSDVKVRAPTRYDLDQSYGTIWVGREELINHVRSLEAKP